MINLRSTVFSLHRQELMAATILLLVYKQWGYAGGSRGTFPIAFGQFFSMASVLNNAIEAWERACYNITNTSFQINYGGPILYLAIGKA